MTHRSGTNTVSSITSAEALFLSGGTLIVNGSVDVNNTVTLQGGTLANATVDLSGGIFDFTSNNNNILDGVEVQGDLTLSASSARARLIGGSTFTGDANLTNTSVTLGYGQTGVVNNTFNVSGIAS
ncbi:MAG: hypothetical protein AAFR02_09560, partial [Pseudomonadota bacterium]